MNPSYEYCTSIGQDSHRFVDTDVGFLSAAEKGPEDSVRPLMLGGVCIPGQPALAGNSDADVILHALTNAISGLTGINILGGSADVLCLEQGIINSQAYLQLALDTLGHWEIRHVSMTIEARRPHLSGWLDAIRKSVADRIGLSAGDVGITATTGEGLTAFGQGEGMQVFCLITARRPAN